jgi:hypothetical protein
MHPAIQFQSVSGCVWCLPCFGPLPRSLGGSWEHPVAVGVPSVSVDTASGAVSLQLSTAECGDAVVVYCPVPRFMAAIGSVPGSAEELGTTSRGESGDGLSMTAQLWRLRTGYVIGSAAADRKHHF